MLNRRNWFKSTLGILVGTGICSSARAKTQGLTSEQINTNTYDVIILGAGTGGLVTAIEAFDLGLKPIVLEKMDFAAGNSLYASGGIAAWGNCTAKGRRS